MQGLAVAVLAVFLVYVAARPEEKYTTKYDNVDLNEIISNKRLLKNYVFCLLGKGNCTPDGSELKKVLPDALKTDCQKCSPKQKDGARIILRHMIRKEPEWYSELEKKYDTEGVYKRKFEEEIEKDEKSKKTENPEKPEKTEKANKTENLEKN